MNGFAIALNINLDYMSFPRSCARLYLKLDFATLSALRSTYLLQGASSRTNWPPSLCPPARLTVGQGRAREGRERGTTSIAWPTGSPSARPAALSLYSVP